MSVFRTLGGDKFLVYHPESTIVRRAPALTLYKRVFLSLSPHTCTLCPMFNVLPSEKYIAIHMLSNFTQHIKFLTHHIIVLQSLDNFHTTYDMYLTTLIYCVIITQHICNSYTTLIVHYATYEIILHNV